MEWGAPEAAHELHRARAGREGHDPGRLQGLLVLGGLVRLIKLSGDFDS